jgi:hypothetical protein
MQNGPFRSRAAIGFSACGAERQNIIKDRQNIIPEVATIAQRGKIPGNCAEVDALCHLDEFMRIVRQGSGKVLAVTVTLNLSLGECWAPCNECRPLLELLRKNRYKIRTLYFSEVDPGPGRGKTSRL